MVGGKECVGIRVLWFGVPVLFDKIRKKRRFG
jgi:hypothetical protein